MPRSVLHTDPKKKQIAKIVRKNSTLGEVMLWKELRDKKMLGHAFVRHAVIGRYTVDFYCEALKLAIEVDGVSSGADAADRERDAKLGKTAVHVLRFDDGTVRNDMKSVLLEIEGWIKEYSK